MAASVSLSQRVSPAHPDPATQEIILVGNTFFADALADHLAALKIPRTIETPYYLQVDDFSFLRDQWITRFDGSCLLPYPIMKRKTVFEFQYKSLLPVCQRTFVESTTDSGLGIGLKYAILKNTALFARIEKIPHTMGKSSIEGGNCFLFKNSKGEPKAIIGIHSLIVTLIGLEEQGYFRDHFKELLTLISQDPPSDELLRMARGEARYAKRLGHDIQWDILIGKEKQPHADWTALCRERLNLERQAIKRGFTHHFFTKLFDPLSDQDKKKFAIDAKMLGAKLILTKRLIARELQVPEDSIVYIPQRYFHIDMEIAVDGPNDLIYIHDEAEVCKVLQGKPLDKKESAYLQAAQDRLQQTADLLPLMTELLGHLDFKVIYVPGIFEAPGQVTNNFMNQFDVDDEHYITGPSSNSLFDEAFKSAIQKANPKKKVSFLGQGTRLVDKLLDCCTEKLTGLRCLTNRRVIRRA